MIINGTVGCRAKRDYASDCHALGQRDIGLNTKVFMHAPLGTELEVDELSKAGVCVEPWADRDYLVVVSHCPARYH